MKFEFSWVDVGEEPNYSSVHRLDSVAAKGLTMAIVKEFEPGHWVAFIFHGHHGKNYQAGRSDRHFYFDSLKEAKLAVEAALWATY